MLTFSGRAGCPAGGPEPEPQQEGLRKGRNPMPVTVIIPTVDRPEILRDCLQGVLLQLGPDDEVIVVAQGTLQQRQATAAMVRRGFLDDPDAPIGLWVHWIVYDIPGNLNEIPENWKTCINEESGVKTGKNSWGKNEYGGPCPPPGNPHRYFFKIYALDIKMNLDDGKTKEEIEEAMQEHIIAEGQLMGRYKR